MKRTVLFPLAAIFAASCINSGASDKSRLELNVETINFCEKEVGKTFHWNDLQLRNTGKDPTTISGIALRGNESCAYRCFYERPPAAVGGEPTLEPCAEEGSAAQFAPIEIAPGTTFLMRMSYTPTAVGVVDRAALVIATDAGNQTSDEEETATLVVTICGKGIEAAPPEPGTDAGAPDPDGGVDASVPVDTTSPETADAGGDCPVCGAPPEPGAPGCVPGV